MGEKEVRHIAEQWGSPRLGDREKQEGAAGIAQQLRHGSTVCCLLSGSRGGAARY